MDSVDVLILGAGWTAEFLIPLLQSANVSFAATTRDGRDRLGQETIRFQFDPGAESGEAFKALPDARTVVVTFPIRAKGGSKTLVGFWKEAHRETKAAFVQLGSSGIWNVRILLLRVIRPIRINSLAQPTLGRSNFEKGRTADVA